MRVITGTVRGRRLATLPGNDVRPTSDRVKEAIFSIMQFDIEGRTFLDLFAGSGQMGIEALSRGAAYAYFNDFSEESVRIVKQNLTATGFSEKARVSKSDYSSFLTRTSERFDIAFLDPPYHNGCLMDALEKTTKVMKEHATILCEHPLDVELAEDVGGFKQFKQYRYGKVSVTVYKKGD